MQYTRLLCAAMLGMGASHAPMVPAAPGVNSHSAVQPRAPTPSLRSPVCVRPPRRCSCSFRESVDLWRQRGSHGPIRHAPSCLIVKTARPPLCGLRVRRSCYGTAALPAYTTFDYSTLHHQEQRFVRDHRSFGVRGVTSEPRLICTRFHSGLFSNQRIARRTSLW